MAPMYSPKCDKKLNGKVVVLTGGNTGIGKETARDLSRRGARVIILCRDTNKGDAAAEEITKETHFVVQCVQLDLASLKSVRECAEKILETEEKIDYLINNAGVMMCPYWKTEDGFEMQFGTNHLGHFLLTEMLMPLVKKSAAGGFRPRIVIVSSVAHESFGINWNDINFEKSYNSLKAYCQSKLANVLHAKELAKRLEGSGISVYSLHPGVIKTELTRHTNETWYGKMFFFFTNAFYLTPVEGCQTTLYCVLEDSIVDHSGRYYSGCQEKNPSANALKEEDQKRLWDISSKLVCLTPKD